MKVGKMNNLQARNILFRYLYITRKELLEKLETVKTFHEAGLPMSAEDYEKELAEFDEALNCLNERFR